MPRCSIPECARAYYAKGYCEMHWRRNRKYGTPHGGDTTHAAPEERFWRRVDIRTHTECWTWLGNRQKSGYGQFQRGGKGSPTVLVHRYAYELHYGSPPPGRAVVVMHSCDNRLCVNPHHRSLGTPRQNTADMDAKGRRRTVAPKGTRNGKAVLDPDKVRMIRASSETNKALAEQLGVSINAVRGVRIGRTWSHVT